MRSSIVEKDLIISDLRQGLQLQLQRRPSQDLRFVQLRQDLETTQLLLDEVNDDLANAAKDLAVYQTNEAAFKAQIEQLRKRIQEMHEELLAKPYDPIRPPPDPRLLNMLRVAQANIRRLQRRMLTEEEARRQRANKTCPIICQALLLKKSRASSLCARPSPLCSNTIS